MTYYYPEGAAGACGVEFKSSNFVAAAGRPSYSCWQCAQINYDGKSVIVQVVDLVSLLVPQHMQDPHPDTLLYQCPGCAATDLDVTPAAFGALASTSRGRIRVTWDWVPCPNGVRRGAMERDSEFGDLGQVRNTTDLVDAPPAIPAVGETQKQQEQQAGEVNGTVPGRFAAKVALVQAGDRAASHEAASAAGHSLGTMGAIKGAVSGLAIAVAALLIA
ncbi:hypothetical protein HDU96_006254 [Phlyctochytrium bullatum]|nr:hypothetical protein HDU96_006254 [Phlyctochytrium bullatum]